MTQPLEDELGWRQRAACRFEDAELFFPERGIGRGGLAVAVRQAFAICRTCTVQAECLDDALEVPETADYGIRAATTPDERKYIRRRRQGGQP